MNLTKPGLLTIAVFAGLGVTLSARGNQPTTVIGTIDDTYLLSGTTAVCGFPVFEHDYGTVRDMTTTLPDGSVRLIEHAVDLTESFFSTDPAHPGIVTVRPTGVFVATNHPDGSATLNSIGTNGHVTIPSQGIVWASAGITKIEIDAAGNVTEVSHGNMSPDHSGICPLL